VLGDKSRLDYRQHDKKERTMTKDIEETTSVYAYEVVMTIQVIAPTRELADSKLDTEGGYVSNRVVNFSHETELQSSKKQEEE